MHLKKSTPENLRHTLNLRELRVQTKNRQLAGLGPSLKVFDAAEAWGNLILKKLEN